MATILVTGAAGFIGRHLCPALTRIGHRVVGLDLEVDCAADGWLMQAAGIDIIIHLAAFAVPAAYCASPAECLRTSLAGTKNVSRLASDLGIPVLFTSSSEVYSPQEMLLAQDFPRSVYAVGKLAAEKILDPCVHRGPVTVLRLHNVYGPRFDAADSRFVPNLVRAMLTNKPFWRLGDPTRPFTYVSDVISIICAQAEKLLDGERGVVLSPSAESIRLSQAVVIANEIGEELIGQERGVRDWKLLVSRAPRRLENDRPAGDMLCRTSFETGFRLTLKHALAEGLSS